MRIEGRDVAPWSEPSSYEAELGPQNVLGGWTVVAEMVGHWSHLNLWFQGEPAYAARPIRVLGRIGGIWAILFAGAIGAPPFPLWAQPGSLTGIVAAVRGRPCDAFQVEVANAVGAVPAPAHWRLFVWGRESDEAAPQAPGGGPQPVIWTYQHDPAPPASVYVASPVPCLLNCAFARNDGRSTRWFQVHDAAAPPVAGAVPIEPGERIRPGCSCSQSYDAARMLTGVALVSSLTPTPYTVDAGASLDMGALVQ